MCGYSQRFAYTPGMTQGTDLQNEIRLALSEDGHMVFRANVAKVRMADGRWFDTGLPKGFSDLFGHRGSDCKAFYIEVKAGRDRMRPEQTAFIAAMRARGALAGVARNVQEARLILAE